MNVTAKSSKLFYGWVVILITFITLLVSAGVRSMPSILMIPFEKEFGWNRSGISGVISIGIFLYGLVGPFSAALLAKFGIRRMMVVSIVVLAACLSITTLMTQLWQFQILWGLVAGLGTGMMANVLGVTVANRWFVRQKGLVIGMLTASAATGQLVFLPTLAQVTVQAGWRSTMLTVAGVLAVLLVIVAIWMRNHPYEVGLPAYGTDDVAKPEPFQGNIVLTPLLTLRSALSNKNFWLLSGTFFFCGFSTNGLIGTHLISACSESGLPEVMAAGLLALMGMFDLVGTTLSGWLSDRYDSRYLLFWYYGLRGLSLFFLPFALDSNAASLLVFSIFYGLDWIATVPPTVKLTTMEFGKEKAGMVLGWIFVAHQIGGSTAASFAGWIRDWQGNYSAAFYSAGFICVIAALMALRISRSKLALQQVEA